MRRISVKKICQNDNLMSLALYDGKKKVGSVPVSAEYKNRTALVHAIEKNGNIRK